MFKWIRKNWKQSLLLATMLYTVHIFVEAFVITNILSLVGLTIPTII